MKIVYLFSGNCHQCSFHIKDISDYFGKINDQLEQLWINAIEGEVYHAATKTE